MKVNKYLYWWIVQGYYGNQYGWEDLTESKSRKEARAWLKDYRDNESYPHRLIQRREPNPEYREVE